MRQEGSSGSLYHTRARYYDATTARFISKEPIWPVPAKPIELNPYQYAHLNPVTFVDVTGLGLADYLWIYAEGDWAQEMPISNPPTPTLADVKWMEEWSSKYAIKAIEQDAWQQHLGQRQTSLKYTVKQFSENEQEQLDKIKGRAERERRAIPRQVHKRIPGGGKMVDGKWSWSDDKWTSEWQEEGDPRREEGDALRIFSQYIEDLEREEREAGIVDANTAGVRQLANIYWVGAILAEMFTDPGVVFGY